MEFAMNANEQHSDVTGKTATLVLYKSVNPSYIKEGMPIPTKLTRKIQVKIPNGKFRTSRKASLTLKTPHRTIRAKALVHKTLHTNLLSITPIVEGLGRYCSTKMEQHCYHQKRINEYNLIYRISGAATINFTTCPFQKA